MAMTDRERIRAALAIPAAGVRDGDPHNLYVIDQMIRVLTGCPTVNAVGVDADGQPYTTVERLGESAEYLAFVAAYRGGQSGDDAYPMWDEGVAR